MPVYDRRYRGYSGERRSPRGAVLDAGALRPGRGLLEARCCWCSSSSRACPWSSSPALIYLANNLDLLQVLGVRWTADDELERTLDGDVLLLVHGRAGQPRLPARLVRRARRWWRPTSRTARCRSTCRARCAAATTCWASSSILRLAALGAHLGARACCWSCCRPRSRAAAGWRQLAHRRSASSLGSLAVDRLRSRFAGARDLGLGPLAPARHRRAVRRSSSWAAPSARPSTRSSTRGGERSWSSATR